MMKKCLVFLLSFVTLFALGFTNRFVIVEAHPATVNVEVVSYFDSQNETSQTILNRSYGSSVAFDGNLGSMEGYNFAFWILNGVVREDLPLLHEFTITSSITLTAIFTPIDKYAVAFMDSNGQLIDVQHITPGGDAQDPTDITLISSYTETFTTFFSTSSTSYTNIGTATDGNGYGWEWKGPQTTSGIAGNSLVLGNNTDGNFVRVTATGGISSFTVDLVRAFTNTNARTVELFVNNISQGSFSVDVSSNTPQQFTVDNMDIAGEVIIELRGTSPGSRGATIVDNFSWAGQGSYATPVLRPGLVLSENRWSDSIINIQENKVVHIRYELAGSPNTYTLTVNNGTGAGTFNFNDVVTVTANEAIDNPFSHWEDHDGNVISLQSSFSFTVMINTEITAVYSANPFNNLPIISLSNDVMLRDEYRSYIGRFYLPEHYELIEYGLISANSVETITLATNGITIYQGFKYIGQTKEFLISLPIESPLSVRAYLTYKHNDTIETVYSDNIPQYYGYSTGFESAEGFTAGTTYNNTTIKYDGPVGQQWGTYYGTASTTGAIAGSQSMQMRWYTSAIGDLGYTFTDFDMSNVEQIKFLASSTSGLRVTVSISTDAGVTWFADELFVLSGTPTTYTYNVPIANQSSSIRARFMIALPDPIPTGTSNLYIDDVEYLFGVTNPPGDNAPEIALHPNAVLSYSIGDLWYDYGCTAIDDIDGEVACEKIDGTVNTNAIGEYTITYYAVDSSNNESFLEVTVVVMRDASILDILLSEYYSDVQGLYGIELLLALHAVLNSGVTRQTYGDARYILQETDRDPLNSDNIILVYLGSSVASTWDLGATWNREHVWPQSLLNVTTDNSSTHIGADLHNLKPADPSENSSRSNKYYDWTTTSSSYAPRDVVKGDVARILFYMITMYTHLDLVNITPDVYEMALLDVLLEWHYLDQVDAFEENRNEVIYFYQNNRNPFIDYPHLVELLWWNYQPLIDLLDSME